MSLWIPFTLAAASFQTVRFMLQKYLSMGQLSASGATFSRFVYSAPLIALGLWAYVAATGQGVPVRGADAAPSPHRAAEAGLRGRARPGKARHGRMLRR